MKFYKLIILSMLFVVFTATAVFSEVVDKIIAVVNDEIVTEKEFNEAFEPYRKRIDDTYRGNDKERVIKETKDVMLQRMIDNMLIESEAKKIGTSIKEEEIMGVLIDMLGKQNIKMEDYLKKLEREGNSLAFVKNEIKSQLMRMRLMRWEIKSKIVVSDQEIGEYYNQHRDEYEGKESVRIKQILLLIPRNANSTTVNTIKEKADQIWKKAVDGEQFDLLAAQYSQGPAALQGGDIGFIEKGGIIPEVETAAFNLPLEQVSNVIVSGIGFHIIKVIDKRGAGVKTMATVREEIKTKLEDGKLEKKYDEWIASLRGRSHIEIR